MEGTRQVFDGNLFKGSGKGVEGPPAGNIREEDRRSTSNDWSLCFARWEVCVCTSACQSGFDHHFPDWTTEFNDYSKREHEGTSRDCPQHF